mgnify:CR=1 FL=1
MNETFTYEVTETHKHKSRRGRWDKWTIHEIPQGTHTEEAEVGTQRHAYTTLRFAQSDCNKCPWSNKKYMDNPMGRCKNCSVLWIWDTRINSFKTDRTLNENGKYGDTVWINKMTGEPVNCLDCGTQLGRTSRGNIGEHKYKAMV